MTRAAVVVALFFCTMTPGSAQDSRLSFEVASVRPRAGPAPLGGGPRARPGGVFEAHPTTVAALIRFAWNIQLFQMAGGPDWIHRDRFDIDARAAGRDVAIEQIRQMVQSLLHDRFQLAMHSEQREMDASALVVARSDGRLGPYVQPMGDECDPAKAAEAIKGFPPRRDTGSAGGLLEYSCVEPSVFADVISLAIQRPVLDRTGLRGKFALQARFASLGGKTVLGAPGDPALPPFDVALKEQLGLKLQPARGPVEVLVIDSVQQPTEN